MQMPVANPDLPKISHRVPRAQTERGLDIWDDLRRLADKPMGCAILRIGGGEVAVIFDCDLQLRESGSELFSPVGQYFALDRMRLRVVRVRRQGRRNQ